MTQKLRKTSRDYWTVKPKIKKTEVSSNKPGDGLSNFGGLDSHQFPEFVYSDCTLPSP